MHISIDEVTFERVVQFFDGDKQAAADFVAQTFSRACELDGGDFLQAARRFTLQSEISLALSLYTENVNFATDGEEEKKELTNDEPPF